MKRFFYILTSLLACVVLFGCAHPINLSPDTKAIKNDGTPTINKQVGYYLPETAKALEVTTPGGGGDKVRYFPYRDLEPGLYQALSSVFSGVTKVKDPKDAADLKSKGIALLITPEIVTSSSSESAFTWPPTKFGIQLTCAITDGDGKTLETVSVRGEGQAEFSEFKHNFYLSAVRASNDVLDKLIKALGEAKTLQQ
ncbi:hypothetical protein [Rhodoferax sp.]|uniref:hypothetical protein n=1 Tax=Rhodoferax sp. TaxID=50421 RepID=UPI00374CF809